MFECDLEHCLSVVVLCMLCKIRCNPMHPICGSLPVPYVALLAARGAVIAHWYTLMRLLAAQPRSIAGLLFPCQYLCGTILVTAYLMAWDWRVSRERPMPFYRPRCSLTFCLLLFFSFLIFHSMGIGIVGLRSSD